MRTLGDNPPSTYINDYNLACRLMNIACKGLSLFVGPKIGLRRKVTSRFVTIDLIKPSNIP